MSRKHSIVFNTMDSDTKFTSLIDLPGFEDGSLIFFQRLGKEDKFPPERLTVDQATGKKTNILLGVEKCSQPTIIMIGKHEENCCAIYLLFVFSRGNEFLFIFCLLLTKERKRTTQEYRRQLKEP